MNFLRLSPKLDGTVCKPARRKSSERGDASCRLQARAYLFDKVVEFGAIGASGRFFPPSLPPFLSHSHFLCVRPLAGELWPREIKLRLSEPWSLLMWSITEVSSVFVARRKRKNGTREFALRRRIRFVPYLARPPTPPLLRTGDSGEGIPESLICSNRGASWQFRSFQLLKLSS